MSRSDGIRNPGRGRRLGRSAMAAFAAAGVLVAVSAAVAPAAQAGEDAPISTHLDQHCATLGGVATDEITVNVENLGPWSGLTSTGIGVSYLTTSPAGVATHSGSSVTTFDASRHNATFTFAVPNPSATDTLGLRVTAFWNSPTAPSVDTFTAPLAGCTTGNTPSPAVFSTSSWPYSSASATATCGARYILLFGGGYIRIPWETIVVHVGPDNKNTTGGDYADMPVWVDYWTDGGTTGYTQGQTGSFDANGNTTLTFTITPTAGTELDLMASSRTTDGRTFPQHLWAPACS